MWEVELLLRTLSPAPLLSVRDVHSLLESHPPCVIIRTLSYWHTSCHRHLYVLVPCPLGSCRASYATPRDNKVVRADNSGKRTNKGKLLDLIALFHTKSATSIHNRM